MSPASAIELLVSGLVVWTLVTLYRREPDPPLRFWSVGFAFHALTTLGVGDQVADELTWRNAIAAVSALIGAGSIVWGTLLHLGMPRPRFWIALPIVVVTLSGAALAFGQPFDIWATPIVVALGGSFIFVGFAVMREWARSAGSRIAGIGLAAYGLHIFDFPIVVAYPAMLPWGHALAVVFVVMIGLGFVMLYFERVRYRVAERDAQYRAVFENAVVGMFVVDDTGVLVAANATLESLVSADRTLRGRPIEALFADPAEARRLLSQRAEFARQTRWIADDGRPLEVHVHARRLPRTSGPDMIEGVVLDVTQLERLQRHFDRVQRIEALGHVAGGIAHDINNVLTVVLANADLLTRAVGSDPRLAELLTSIREASQQGAGLTRQLLTFARSQPTASEIFELGPCVERVARMLVPSLGETIRVELDVAATDCTVRADPAHVEQLVVNLVLNARDALPSGGTIAVAVRRPAADPSGRVLLEVRDDGIGMDASTLSRAFEPFYSNKAQHTGLGLAVVQRVVGKTGAELAVDSSPGHGTTFRIWFPRAIGIERPPAPASDVAGPVAPLHILVVEDRPDVRRAIVGALADLGYQVTAPAGPREAVALVEDGLDVSVVVTDVRMPELSGPQVARELWRLRPELPVVFVSGHVADDDLTELLKLPWTRFVAKPFGPDTLVAAVRVLAPGRPVRTSRIA